MLESSSDSVDFLAVDLAVTDVQGNDKGGGVKMSIASKTNKLELLKSENQMSNNSKLDEFRAINEPKLNFDRSVGIENVYAPNDEKEGMAIWTYKNDVVFNEKIWASEQILKLSKVKVAWWMHAKWLGHFAPIMNLARFPNKDVILTLIKKSKNYVPWSKPRAKCLKFNTDRSFKSCLGDSRIGGVLRNESKDVLTLLSKAISISNSTKVKLFTIKEAAIIYTTSR
ncbi:Uncharacterized protein TCM_001954 [Theobroma cacao]|uniref:Uncharacterized protein n=1 Tax=Theobroma cacao TaxID=3641 RepID=A0A061DKC3_THECC|nr:Uncharacterized protein TCM_001954 [Theobroma cacao]